MWAGRVPVKSIEIIAYRAKRITEYCIDDYRYILYFYCPTKPDNIPTIKILVTGAKSGRELHRYFYVDGVWYETKYRKNYIKDLYLPQPIEQKHIDACNQGLKLLATKLLEIRPNVTT